MTESRKNNYFCKKFYDIPQGPKYITKLKIDKLLIKLHVLKYSSKIPGFTKNATKKKKKKKTMKSTIDV